MSALALGRQQQIASQLLAEMWHREVTPDLRTYEAGAAACGWQEALDLWEQAPFEATRGRMQALAEGRRWQQATVLLKELKLVPPAPWHL